MNFKRNVLLTAVGTALVFSNLKIKAQEKSDSAKTQFKPSGKVWGYVFGDYYTKLHADSLNRGNAQYSGLAKDMNAFDFRRAYLGYDYNFNEKFRSEILLAYEGQTLSDNVTRTVFIKSANIRWKNIIHNVDLILGQSATPSWPYTSEKNWGYRSVEKTIMDMRKIGSSNDFGLALESKLLSNENTEIGIHLMVGNGTAQKLELDRFKKIYGDIYAKVMDKKIFIELYSDYERINLDPYHKSKMTVKSSLAYISDIFTAGVEVYNQNQENYVINADSLAGKKDTANATSFGFSVFIKGMIIKDKLGYFARYDRYNPDANFNENKYYFSGASPVSETFITAGVDYTPNKNVHIMPNIWYNAYTNNSKNVNGMTRSDYDLVARLTFYYIFK